MNKDEEKLFLPIHGSMGGDEPDEPDPPPPDDPNNLRSKTVATFVDLLCEGEIQGLVNAGRSIFFNEVPQKDNDENIWVEGVLYDFKPGRDDPETLEGFTSQSTEISVDTKIEEGTPLTKVITNLFVDHIYIKYTIPSLFSVNTENGQVRVSTLAWHIDVKAATGGWQRVNNAQTTVDGKCIAAYQRQIKINNLALNYGPGPWEIRTTRDTPNSDTQNLQNDLFLASYTEIVDANLMYPNSAAIGVKLNAGLFGSRVPSRAYEIRGLKIEVPSNYFPERVDDPENEGGGENAYVGIWDGQFKEDKVYSNNPAWVYYDILSNDRYGLGLEAEFIDKWTLYNIGKYCDKHVKSGVQTATGVPIMERRFTFNGVIQTREDAVNILSTMTSNFRGMPYWGGGQATASQDSDRPVTKLVNQTNIIDGEFMYRGSSLKDRHTAVNVTWNNPDDFYRRTVEAVDDADGISRYGYRPIDVVAFGCTSRGQAYRYGKWLLDTELVQTETCTYRASWDHADVVPGDIIEVTDPDYAAERYGGRAVAIGSNTITLDSPVTLVSGIDYTIDVMREDETIVERNVTNVSDDLPHTVITVNSAWSTDSTSIPIVNAVWVMTGLDYLHPRLFRVGQVAEVEKNMFEITAAIYDEGKFDRVEDDQVFDPPPLSTNPDSRAAIEPPTHLVAQVYTYENSSTIATREFGIMFSWIHTRDTRFTQYDIQWKSADSSYALNETKKTSDTYVDIQPLGSNVYDFRIRATGLGQPSVWVTLSNVALNADPSAPPNITGLEVINGPDADTFDGPDCEIEWDPVVLTTDTTTGIHYDTTALIPLEAAPFDSELTKNKDYHVQVLTTGDVVRRNEFVTDNKFTYTMAMNLLDSQGGLPLRDFKFSVTARDIFDKESNEAAILTVDNPAPDMSSLTPTLVPVFNGIKVDWSAITPGDTDMSHFKVFMDTNADPVTEVAQVSANTDFWTEFDLVKDTTYRAKIVPYDLFGIGLESDVVQDEVIPLTQDDIEGELTGRLTYTDNIDSSSSSLTYLYDHVRDSGPGLAYDSGDWIKVDFPLAQLIDRVSLWADKNFNCYFSISENDTDWTYYGAEADHTLDAEGRLIEQSAGDAETNYWTADAGDGAINIALLPNGLVGKQVRIHLLTNATEFYEYVVTDQVIAEWIIANQLSAISADLGTITAGDITINNLGFIKSEGKDSYTDNTAGFWLGYDIADYKFNLGDASEYLKWNGSSLSIKGVATFEAGSSGYSNITDKPISLDDINAAEGDQLQASYDNLFEKNTWNLVHDPNFEKTTSNTDQFYWSQPAYVDWRPVDGFNASPGLRFSVNGLPPTHSYVNIASGQAYYPAKYGDLIYVKYRYYASAAFDGTKSRLTIITYDKNKSGLGFYNVDSPSLVLNTWTFVEGIVEITDGNTDFFSIRVSRPDGAAVGFLYYDDVYVSMNSDPAYIINNNPALTTIDGGKITTGTITANEIAANTITAAEIQANSITANELNVGELSAISADLGTVTAGNITLGTGDSGFIRGGKPSYASATAGFFLGYTGGAWKFDIGSSTRYMRWDGATLSILGNITNTGGQINATYITTGGMSAARITFGSMSGDRIIANTLNANRIVANTITADKIIGGEITQNVATLTAGTIAVGASTLIQTRAITSQKGGFMSIRAGTEMSWGGTESKGYVWLLRNGVEVARTPWQHQQGFAGNSSGASLVFVDTAVGTGSTVTYTLYASRNFGTNAYNRFIGISEYKR